MKILLDEGVPHKLRRTLQENTREHSFFTAHYVGLTGNSPEFRNLSPRQKDEKLLREAKAQDFDAVITIDKSMQIEQNNRTPINVLTLNVGRENQQDFENIQLLIPKLNVGLSEVDASIRQGREPTFRTIDAVALEPQQPALQPEQPRPGLPSAKDMADEIMGPDREAQAKREPAPEPKPELDRGLELRRRRKPTGEEEG